MKFPTNKGISQVRVNQQVVRWCYIASLHGYNPKEKLDQETPRKNKILHECQMINSTLLEVEWQDWWRLEPKSKLEDFKIYGDDNDRKDRIEANLEPSDKTQLKNLIKRYKDTFAWLPMDMPRIDINVSCHKLSINKGVKPI